MPKQINQSPGTVSKILWHFTGGPDWNSEEKRQNRRPKPAARAYRNLKAILKTREVRIGQYTEIVSVRMPKRRTYNTATKTYDIERNARVEMSSAPVCCLSDIPIAHLAYHASRYGKFAIGFHRDAVLEHGFNPVFYTLENTKVIQSIYSGFTQLKNIDTSSISSAASDIESEVSLSEGEDDIQISSQIYEIESEADSIDDYVIDALTSFKQFLGFVKTFQENEFGSIYCEREWRSLKTYSFTLADVAMIVLPKRVGSHKYFEPFVKQAAKSIKLARSIPIVPWEDLIEH
jgi:Putative abortive phage resistance protein AbiGi, antitoxin